MHARLRFAVSGLDAGPVTRHQRISRVSGRTAGNLGFTDSSHSPFALKRCFRPVPVVITTCMSSTMMLKGETITHFDVLNLSVGSSWSRLKTESIVHSPAVHPSAAVTNYCSLQYFGLADPAQCNISLRKTLLCLDKRRSLKDPQAFSGGLLYI